MAARREHAKQQKTAENLPRLATVSKDGKDISSSTSSSGRENSSNSRQASPLICQAESSLFDGTAEQYPLASLHFTMLSLLLLLLLPVYTHRWDCTVEKGEKVTMIH